MFVIDKTFEFCYGHRVWTQVLRAEFADDLKCACRHLHGHEAKVQVFMESATLDPQGMVTDFRHLEWLKKWINANLDHKFILDRHDPLFPSMVSEVDPLLPVEISSLHVGYTVAPQAGWTGHFREMQEGFFIVDFPPTSENLSRWLHGIVTHVMRPFDLKVSQLDWWETPKSRSSYRG